MNRIQFVTPKDQAKTAATAPAYVLRCRACGATFEDDGFQLVCPEEHEPALLVTEYAQRTFEPDADGGGLFRYASWLPVRRLPPGAGGTVTFQSSALSAITGLSNLWVSFNGYWPERGTWLQTATFKELEAWTVLARLPVDHDSPLVVSSAGNTGAAFARLSSRMGVRCVVIVPDYALERLRFTDPVGDLVTLVSIVGGDYHDAIQLGERLAHVDGFTSAGGVRNVGRRDGLATVFLNAVETIGRLPDFYFQAVGSAAGGIATFEAVERLLADGRFGDTAPRLMLSQNAPFAPIHDSWHSGERRLVEYSDEAAKSRAAQLLAPVLSNRQPAFSTRGGVYDALMATDGDVLLVDNAAAQSAQELFEELEGIDLEPASGVALASLLQAVRDGRVPLDASVLLNLTGGGHRRLEASADLLQARPDLELDASELASGAAASRIAAVVG